VAEEYGFPSVNTTKKYSSRKLVSAERKPLLCNNVKCLSWEETSGDTEEGKEIED
jgi:hypothetical protein